MGRVRQAAQNVVIVFAGHAKRLYAQSFIASLSSRRRSSFSCARRFWSSFASARSSSAFLISWRDAVGAQLLERDGGLREKDQPERARRRRSRRARRRDDACRSASSMPTTPGTHRGHDRRMVAAAPGNRLRCPARAPPAPAPLNSTLSGETSSKGNVAMASLGARSVRVHAASAASFLALSTACSIVPTM